MAKATKVSIVGPTGVVGSELLGLISDSKLQIPGLVLFSSEESSGEVYAVGELESELQNISSEEGLKALKASDLIIFCVHEKIVKDTLKEIKGSQAKIIDISGVAVDSYKPRIVMNTNEVSVKDPFISLAHPTTLALTPALNALHKSFGVESVTLTAFDSVSGGGKNALDELWDQTIAICNQRSVEVSELPHQIAFNLIPQVGVLRDDGWTSEEVRLRKDINILLPSISVSVTAVRVPVFHGNAGSLTLSLSKSATIKDAEKILGAEETLQLLSGEDDYPMPLTVTGSNEVHIGRIRADEKSVSFWFVYDSVRRTASLLFDLIRQVVQSPH